MFELVNVEGKIKLRCEIVGYQFPESTEEDWCLLKVTVMQNSFEFTATDASITALELVRLNYWFFCLSKFMLPEYGTISFIEPCIELSFLRYAEESVRISVRLMRELEPTYPIEQFRPQMKDWNIVFELSSNDFKGVLTGMKATIAEYPARGGQY